MLMLPSYLAVVVLVFVLKIIGMKAACYWNGDLCLIYCTNMRAADTIAPIETLYAQREHCHPEFTLQLRTLTYPNNTIGPFWFNATIRAVQLEVYFNDIVSLSADAFNSDAFQPVKKLTFRNFGVSSMVKGTFNGLDTLEIINVNGASKVDGIDAGVLDSITELQEFTFEQSTKSPELNIDGFTGSSVLWKLEYVKIRYNLATSIKTSTFIGLRNVKRLDLSSCYISSIEDNSFDPISETIEELDLSSNAFTTVSYGLLSEVLPNIKTIKFDGIKWNCVCDLIAFRVFVERYKENVVGINCFSPAHCSTTNILETDCFDSCEVASTTVEGTETTVENTEPTSEDTEATSKDTEASSEDTEATSEDTEATSEDTEATSEDTEATSEDPAPTIENTETTIEDTETTFKDTEATIEDTEITTEDTELTIENTETTIEDTAPTIEDTETTIDDATPSATTNTSVSNLIIFVCLFTFINI